jgi:hypothetical protein
MKALNNSIVGVLLFFSVYAMGTGTAMAAAEWSCEIEIGTDRIDRKPVRGITDDITADLTERDACAEAAEAVNTVNVQTLNRVAKEQATRNLARFLSANPDAFGEFDEFVYVPPTVSLFPLCCNGEPGGVKTICSLPNRAGQCPLNQDLRYLCGTDVEGEPFCTPID